MNPHLKRFSYEVLARMADEILEEAGYLDQYPVDVLQWVEVDLGIEVHPYPGLKRYHQVEGFLGAGLKTLTIDHDLYFEDRYLNRCRFTFAHELSHFYLHRSLFESADFGDIGEYLAFRETISDEDLKWFEWQGYSLGGLLLVPRSRLRGFFNEEMVKNADGLEGGAETFQAEALAASIDSGCKFFGVSRQTMIKRLGLDSILKV